MIGQGRPNRLLAGGRCAKGWARTWLLAIALIAVPGYARSAPPEMTKAAVPTLRIRVAWGGGPPRRWSGHVAVTGGRVEKVRLLGIEADEPGSIWMEDGRVVVAQPTSRSYDGLDLDVLAPLEERLTIELSADDRPPRQVEVPLASLLESQHVEPLDEEGNRIFVRRCPGDALRVEVHHRSLVFSTGEPLRADVEPQLLGVPPRTSITLGFVLRSASSGRKFWSAEQHQLAVDRYATLPKIPIEVPLPEEEGVYNLVITASVSRGPMPLGLKQTLAERTVQLVVIDSRRHDGDAPRSSPHRVVEIDPANPTWWRRLDLTRWIPGWRKGPVGSGDTETFEHPLSRFVRLGPDGRSPRISWQAYPLPIEHPGRPHVLELEYPSDVPQTMGISVVEPNAAGIVTPIALDSGLYVDQEASEQPSHVGTHRLVFWPRTKSPLVIITNRRDGSHAVYGKLRVFEYDDHLPVTKADQLGTGRLLMAYMARPLFTKNFSSSEAIDPLNGRGFEDWTTFYDGAVRLVEYLKYSGYSGLMMAVCADGSAIYPSHLLEPTPRYDRGVFFSSGQDPLRKDVVELLMRLFDREGLQFVPALEFTGTLPRLEATLHGASTKQADLDWINGQGRRRLEIERQQRSRPAVSYNVLRPKVQDAMGEVAEELIGRYGDHESFGGVTIQMAPHGFAHLPGPGWGVDDATLSQFEDETKVRLPEDGTDPARRFAERAAALETKHRQTWDRWRTERLAALYQRIQATVASAKPAAKLYLACAEVFTDPLVRESLQPSLPPTTTLGGALRQLGLDPKFYADRAGTVLLRPYRLQSSGDLAPRAIELVIDQPDDLDRRLSSAVDTGSQFLNVPQTATLPSFDAVSPFRSSSVWMMSEFAPAGAANRRRLAQSLAVLDPNCVVDGGWMLTMGQEAATQAAVDVFRHLPAKHFETVPTSTDPVIVRTLVDGDRTYLYLVNDAPGPIDVTLSTTAPGASGLEIFGDRLAWSAMDGQAASSWSIRLKAYGLAGGMFPTAGVRVTQATVSGDDVLRATMKHRIRQLEARAIALEKQPPLEVLQNPGFEFTASGGEDRIAGWSINEVAGVSAELDKEQPHEGNQSLRLESTGPVATLVSRSFAAPDTGRLSVWVWLRTDNASTRPALRIAVEKATPGSSYYRYALVGRAAEEGQLSSEWRQYVFHVDDLCVGGPCQIRVRFDLMVEGKVWLDGVELFDRRFHEHELRELTKIIAMANVKLQAGELANCHHLLEGYWPQFLLTYVPLADEPVIAQPIERDDKTTPRSAQGNKAKPQGILGRLNHWLPKSIRF